MSVHPHFLRLLFSGLKIGERVVEISQILIRPADIFPMPIGAAAGLNGFGKIALHPATKPGLGRNVRFCKVPVPDIDEIGGLEQRIAGLAGGREAVLSFSIASSGWPESRLNQGFGPQHVADQRE